jgi:hypothetical protein
MYSGPTGALIGPLGLLALIFGRKKKSSKAYPFLLMFVMLIVLPLSVGMACEEEYTSTPAEEPEQPYEVETPGPGTVAPGIPGTPTPPATQPEAVPCPTPGNTDLENSPYGHEIGQFPNLATGITEATEWVRNFLQAKAQNLLKDLQFILVNKGPGMWAKPESHVIEVSSELGTYSVDSNRTRAIHELGHFVDYYSGKYTFGTPYYSASHWVQEWETRPEQFPEHPDWTFFTGEFSDLPSDYLLAPTLEHEGRFCVHSSGGGVPACAAEDFAETFTWMTYTNKGLALHMLDYNNDYNIPSNVRQTLVYAAIDRLP